MPHIAPEIKKVIMLFILVLVAIITMLFVAILMLAKVLRDKMVI